MSKKLTFHIKNTSNEPIFNTLSTMSVWNPLFYNDAHVGDEPDGFIKEMYPWVDYFILMTFTGGRDYNNWCRQNNNGALSYSFELPIEILRNVIRGGVKPFIVLGQVPYALSRKPADKGGEGTHWGNRYAPLDYQKYFDYMKAFAKALVDHFGKAEIKTWKFRLMTEWDDCFDVQNWWKESYREYAKLYDYTLAALASEIDEENLFYGPGNVKEMENLEVILKHCARGKNYYTGKIGSKCDHISMSEYYSNTNVEFMNVSIRFMRQLIGEFPELDIKEYGYGEAGFANDCLGNRLHAAQGITEDYASALARLLDISNHRGNAYFANWEYLTDRANYQIDLPQKPYLKPPVAKAAELIHARLLHGKKLLSDNFHSSREQSFTNAIASVHTAHISIMIYNHSSIYGRGAAENLTLVVSGLSKDRRIGDITLDRVDMHHGNFSTIWLEDSKGFERKEIMFDMNTKGSSSYDTPVTLYLSDEHKAFYRSKRESYQDVSEKTNANDFTYTADDTQLTICLTMPECSVAFLKISFTAPEFMKNYPYNLN